MNESLMPLSNLTIPFLNVWLYKMMKAILKYELSPVFQMLSMKRRPVAISPPSRAVRTNALMMKLLCLANNTPVSMFNARNDWHPQEIKYAGHISKVSNFVV